MERNVSNVAREAQGRIELEPQRIKPKPQQQQQQAATTKKQDKGADNPSATSKFSRRWSFKKLSKMNSKKNSGN